ncbi:MAG: hypothetical protein ACFFF4_14310 [Candidatus Thorarchaeota archaeon]
MKPIGTITNTLPFVEPKYLGNLELIMEESLNYFDFSKRLCDFVLSIDASDELVFIALYHADQVSYTEILDDIRLKYPDSPILRPTYSFMEMNENNNWDWNRLLEEVTHAIFCTDNLLIKLDLHNLKWICIRGTSPSSADEERIVQKIQELLDSNDDTHFWKTRLYEIRADQLIRDNKWSEAIDLRDLAYETALKYNDIDFSFKIKRRQAYTLTRICDPQALDTVNQANQIGSDLGYADRLFDITTAMIHDTRGEYNRACELVLELLDRRIQFDSELSLRVIPQYLSRLFRRMGQQSDAIEWAKKGLESKPMLAFSHNHARQILSKLGLASSLALLGKTSEAVPHLDDASRLIMESSSEHWLSDMYLCHGLIERAEGNLHEAMNYFEKAFDIISRLQRQERINEALFRLAENEILIHADNIEELFKENTRSWNQQLEDMAMTKELPGILGLAYFLKAQILVHQNKTGDARKYLLRVRELAMNPTTKFLRNYLDTLPFYQEVLADFQKE